jgi:hypothetical protein
VYGLTQKNLSPSLQVKVGARISRMSYGVEYKQKWKAKKHQKRDKVWDDMEHEFMAENQMKWFLQQVSQQRLNVRSIGVGRLPGRRD